MNCSHFRPNLTLLTGIVALLLIASSPGTPQDATCTLSGRVVDVEGNPIAELPIAIHPFVIIKGTLGPAFLLKEFMPEAYAPRLKSQTDEAGRFSVTGIKPGPIQVVAQPAHMPDDGMLPPDFDLDDLFASDTEVLSIEIGAITFYPSDQKHPPFSGITFAIEPGTHLENVEVTVYPRMRIRGRIVFADGTSLANAQVRLSVRRRDFDGTGTGSSGGAPRTDDAGYFVEYVDEPGFYTVWVEFQGLSATSEQFILEAGQRRDDLVLTFDSEPIPIEPAPGRVEPDSAGAWVVNPANGHSYKSIHCESWDDAQAKAVAEGAYLVSINDEAEQQWLVGIFGFAPYWIGLTDVAKDGEWQWTSGEPATYTNWAPREPKAVGMGKADYVFMGLSPDGKWHSVGPESPEWRMTRMSILEKGGLPAKLPVEDK